jgi:hypothetical protein
MSSSKLLNAHTFESSMTCQEHMSFNFLWEAAILETKHTDSSFRLFLYLVRCLSVRYSDQGVLYEINAAKSASKTLRRH